MESKSSNVGDIQKKLLSHKIKEENNINVNNYNNKFKTLYMFVPNKIK